MSWLLRLVILVVSLTAIAAVSYQPARTYYKQRTRPVWRTTEITRGSILTEVTATGEVKPVQSVVIGSFVSGPIKEIFVDFNQKVKKDEMLAKIDPRLYRANVERDEAALRTRNADVERVKALLWQAQRDEQRARSLQEENSDYIAQAEVDKYVFNTMQLKAQLAVTEAAVEQATAALENSRANLIYTDIQSPIDGIVIDRKIDPGQTLAASFQTPELFTIAPDMDKEMHVFASVDEADIGLIMLAERHDRPVHFTVDAWPDDLFVGRIQQVRFSSTTTQNVVTYPVIVAAPNPDLKLLPGMTASLSFVVEEHNDILRVPRTALRFLPEKKYVRSEDQHLIVGETDQRAEPVEEPTMTTSERMVIKRRERKRHIWVVDEEKLRAVEVEEGASDARFMQVTAPELAVGQKVVIGQETSRPSLVP